MAKIEHTVLAVIDMQKGFLNPHSNHILQNVDNLIRTIRDHSIPVVFSRFFNFVGSPYEILLGWDRVHAQPETDIVDELCHFADTVIDKNFYTSLTPEFIQLIESNNWKTVILCGIATESCVLKTAADAFERGLRPIVISDACASDVGPDSHSAGLIALESLIGKPQIMTVGELLRTFADC